MAQAPADSPDHVFPLLRGGFAITASGERAMAFLFLLPALIQEVLIVAVWQLLMKERIKIKSEKYR